MNRLAPVADIQAKVAAYCEVPLRVIKNYERSPSAIDARQIAAFLAHEITGQGPYQLARRFARDHSTIRHSIQRVRERCLADPAYSKTVLEIMGKILGLSTAEPTEKHQPTMRNSQENAIEQSVKMQEQRVAA